MSERGQPWRPRMVVSDLDGTLLRSDLSVSDETRATIAKVVASGCPFVLATGRPSRWLSMVTEEIDHRGIAVCANGAELVDLAADEVCWSRPLDPGLLGWLTGAIRRVLPEAAFAVEHGNAFRHEAAYRPRGGAGFPVVSAAELPHLVDAPAVKLLVRAEGLSPDEMASYVVPAVANRAVVTHSSLGGLLEISAPGVTKATGLVWLAAKLGIVAADVLVFGDMPNDLSMFAWAGRAVAVAGAHPDVLAQADDLTGTNDEDGVAGYLSRLGW